MARAHRREDDIKALITQSRKLEKQEVGWAQHTAVEAWRRQQHKLWVLCNKGRLRRSLFTRRELCGINSLIFQR